MKMLDEINKKFNFKYNFLRVLDVNVNTLLSCAEIVFMYAEKLPDLTQEQQNEITEFVTQTLALNCDVKVKFKKSYIDKKIIEEFCYKFLKNNYSSMFSVVEGKFIDAQINEDNVLIVLNLNKNLIDYIQSNNIREMFLQSLNKCFIANFNITFSSKDVKDVDESVLQIREEEFLGSIKQQKAEPRYDVLYPTPLFGSEIVIKPEFICNLEKDKEGVALAGVVCDLVCKSYVSKRHKAKGENVQSYYFKFSLADVSGNIDCICFSTKTTYKKLIDLKDGDQILVFGNVKISSKERCVTVKAVSFCELDNAIAKIILEECKKVEIKKDLVVPTYKNIIPTKYDVAVQSNFFEKKVEYNSYVNDNSFVVFDVETTGLSAEYCEIIEIGAIKVEKGVMTEQFSCFVKPTTKIPSEITNLTGITDEMVEDAYEIKDVIYDFYKFCQNCTIVAYNKKFDMSFIQAASNKCGFAFTNEEFDAMVLAKNSLYLPRYKLISVCEHLEISLEGAHRAVNDAIATAKVFLKLQEV